MEPDNPSAQETIQHVGDRLLLWARRADKGFARASFFDAQARDQVIANITQALSRAGVHHHHIHLPSGLEPSPLVEEIIKRLAPLPPCVVSITGLETALPSQETEQQNALYALNFNRERLAAFPLRQIWWLPEYLADLMAKAVPDLISWFMVKVDLKEFAPCENYIEEPPEEIPPGDAQHTALELKKRFFIALARGEAVDSLLESLFIPAFEQLCSAGYTKEALEFEGRVLQHLRGSDKESSYPEDLYVHLIHQLIQKTKDRLGPNNHETAKFFRRLAITATNLGRFHEAVNYAAAALENDRRAFDSSHPEVLEDLNLLARSFWAVGQLQKAESLLREGLTIARRYAKSDQTVLKMKNNLGGVLKAMGRLKEAEPLHRQVLSTFQKTYGEDNPRIAGPMSNLAGLLSQMGHLEEAETLYRESINLTRSSLGEHPRLATRLNNLGNLLRSTNRHDEAEPFLREAVAIVKRRLGATHPTTAMWMSNLAQLLEAQGKINEALALFQQSLTIAQAKLDASHPFRQRLERQLQDLENRT